MFIRQSGKVVIRLKKGARERWAVTIQTPYDEPVKVFVSDDDLSDHLRGSAKLDAIAKVALRRAEHTVRVERHAEMRGDNYVISNRVGNRRAGLIAKIKRALNELE